MPTYTGKCSNCGKTHHSSRKDDIVICDCWQYCPMCGAEMQDYAPDLAPKTYGADGKHELSILKVCSLHSPPFFSQQKPVEVVCT
ncbi:MAG TPA: hypothetical protein VMT01_02625 [Candidatus Acidoferrum sp.]|nr:hypothetical protein [Candidatus Acidoferrum sp.]